MKSLKILMACSLLWMGSACTADFEDINTNPNLIDQISPGTLLNEIIYNMASNNVTNHYNINCQLMQVQLPYQSFIGGVQRYEILPTTGTSQWNAAYKWAKNIQEMRISAETSQSGNYLAMALTLNAWVYANLVDTFGDVPFSEASKLEDDIIQPKYDKQEDIYTQLLADLKQANTLYDHSNTLTYGEDILYGQKKILHERSRYWQKFTNSLRLRLLLRVSNVLPSAYQEMQEIINNPEKYPIISNMDEAAIFNVTGATPNLSPWSRKLDFSNQHAVAEFFIEALNDLKDPRRPLYVSEAKQNTISIGYKGIPSAYDDQNFNYSPSYMNNEQVVAPMIIPILSYAEVCFIKAELAQKGYLTGAETYFKDGIRAAVQLWTNTELPETYFDAKTAKYDGTLERIMLHKYLALYFTDNQQWAEYRRTGYPKLPKTKSMMNEGVMPSRLLYPDVQPIYNPKNYEEAVARMGGDNINVKVWWDVK